MSNIALLNPNQAPSFVKARTELGPLAKALGAGSDGGGGKRVSIKGGVFRLFASGKQIAAVEERFMDIVIVNAAPKVSRVLYLSKWDPENPASPDCWSPDGEKPSPDARDAQATRCADCAQNIAGSGNGNSRACKYQQRLAIVLADDMNGDVLQLSLPATSLFGKAEGEKMGLQAYVRWLAAQNIDPSDVVTRIRFDTDVESPKLLFKGTRWLTEEEHEICQSQGTTEDATKAITMTVAKTDKVEDVAAPADELEGTAPKAAKAKAKAKAAKPAVEADAEDDGAEPEVRKSAPKETAVPKAKAQLADMVDDWDD